MGIKVFGNVFEGEKLFCFFFDFFGIDLFRSEFVGWKLFWGCGF